MRNAMYESSQQSKAALRTADCRMPSRMLKHIADAMRVIVTIVLEFQIENRKKTVVRSRSLSDVVNIIETFRG
jgi:hypothetical protein